MNTKLIKILLIILSFLLCAWITTICVFGVMHSESIDASSRFIEAAFRCVSVFIFSIIYYTALTSDSGPDSMFIPYYLISFIISEIRIFGTFADCFSYTIIPPMIGVTVFIVSVIFMCLSLIGYGIYYENRNYTQVSKFQILSLAASFIIAVMIPKIPDYFSIIKTTQVKWLTAILMALTALVFLILVFKDANSSDVIRHIAALLLIAGNFTNIFFDSYVMNLAATIFTFIGLAIITILAKVNEIKF